MERYIIAIRRRDEAERTQYLVQYKILRHGGVTNAELSYAYRAENARRYRSKRQAQIACLVLYRYWGEECTFTIRAWKEAPHA